MIGTERIMYDIYGNTVVTAQKLEATGLPDKIQISEAFYQHIKTKFPDRFMLEETAVNDTKQYYLNGKKQAPLNYLPFAPGQPHRASVVYRITRSSTRVDISGNMSNSSAPPPFYYNPSANSSTGSLGKLPEIATRDSSSMTSLPCTY